MLSERQAYRWVTGELSTLLYPAAQATLEEMFGELARWIAADFPVHPLTLVCS